MPDNAAPANTWDGARIRALRERLGLTQERFAHRLSTTVSSVSHWEADKRRPLPIFCTLLTELEAATEPAR